MRIPKIMVSGTFEKGKNEEDCEILCPLGHSLGYKNYKKCPQYHISVLMIIDGFKLQLNKSNPFSFHFLLFCPNFCESEFNSF